MVGVVAPDPTGDGWTRGRVGFAEKPGVPGGGLDGGPNSEAV